MVSGAERSGSFSCSGCSSVDCSPVLPDVSPLSPDEAIADHSIKNTSFKLSAVSGPD